VPIHSEKGGGQTSANARGCRRGGGHCKGESSCRAGQKRHC
jgi:hypothetical protein